MDEEEIKKILDNTFERVLSELLEEMNNEILKTMCMMFWTYRNAYMMSLVNPDKGGNMDEKEVIKTCLECGMELTACKVGFQYYDICTNPECFRFSKIIIDKE